MYSIINNVKNWRVEKENNFMFDKLEAVEARYEELTKLISDPEIIANQAEWQKLIKDCFASWMFIFQSFNWFSIIVGLMMVGKTLI